MSRFYKYDPLTEIILAYGNIVWSKTYTEASMYSAKNEKSKDTEESNRQEKIIREADG